MRKQETIHNNSCQSDNWDLEVDVQNWISRIKRISKTLDPNELKAITQIISLGPNLNSPPIVRLRANSSKANDDESIDKKMLIEYAEIYNFLTNILDRLDKDEKEKFIINSLKSARVRPGKDTKLEKIIKDLFFKYFIDKLDLENILLFFKIARKTDTIEYFRELLQDLYYYKGDEYQEDNNLPNKITNNVTNNILSQDRTNFIKGINEGINSKRTNNYAPKEIHKIIKYFIISPIKEFQNLGIQLIGHYKLKEYAIVPELLFKNIFKILAKVSNIFNLEFNLRQIKKRSNLWYIYPYDLNNESKLNVLFKLDNITILKNFFMILPPITRISN